MMLMSETPMGVLVMKLMMRKVHRTKNIDIEGDAFEQTLAQTTGSPEQPTHRHEGGSQ